MANNALLYNAAYVGFLGGSVAGQKLTSIVSADYTALVNQATQFATEMDSLIANDLAASPQPAGSTQISIAGGAAIVPAGSTAVFESQNGKLGLIQQLCYSFAFQRYGTGALAATFADICTAIKALYFQAVPGLVVT